MQCNSLFNQNNSFNLGKEALIASGINDDFQLNHYMNKLNKLYDIFIQEGSASHNDLTKAKELFNWLWAKKPLRYKRNGEYKLHNVVDAQTSEHNREVGNCLGLTLLYNCLAKKTGIVIESLYLEHAFENGPHVLSIIEIENSQIDVENILSKGFDYKEHANNSTRTRWGDKELVAEIYNSMGNELFEKGELNLALEYYNKSIKMNPSHELAQLNKIILLDKMSMGN
ncbi:MAG: tetratricopeptide repeat protein [Spirochaetota bacterium]|nr:tetratricopeptide repeat protein [Spirochaetota bacterium]